MDSTQQKNDELLLTFLRGECSSEEARVVRLWLAESDSNKHYFESLRQIWDLSADMQNDADFDVDVDAALSKVNRRIDASEKPERKPILVNWFKRNYRAVSAVAAFVAVALAIGYFVKNKYNATVVLAASDWNIAEPYILPDGTSVMMQENAVLKYPKNFDKDRRSLDFEGVAYFDVARDEAKPFVIHCGNMAVEVLGTSFDLSACKDESEYELNLVSGKVSMTSFDENGGILDQAVLYPGERGVFSVFDGNLHRLNKMEVLRADAIENHVLDFNNAKLSEVIESLRFIYDLDIDLDENCADYRLTARLDGESVESVLETIAAVFGLQVVNDGTTILIK